MDGYHPGGLLVVVLLLLAVMYVFFFSLAIAITKSRSKRLRELALANASGDPRLARFMLSQARRYLLTAHAGMYLSGLCAGGLALSISDHMTGFFGATVAALLGPFEFMLWFSAIIVGLVLVTLSLVQIVKPYVFDHPEIILSRAGLALVLCAKVLSPIVFALDRVVGGVLRGFGLRVPVERELAVSAEELSEIVEMSSEAGEIEEDEREMIQGIFNFSDTVVREVMTPRKDIVSISETASLEEVLAILQTERLSRLVVTGADLDDIRGILLAKDFIDLLGKVSPRFEMRRFMRPAYFVANTKKVDSLLEEFKRDAVHFAVVLDEHGGVDGVVTVEDLIEEIVGEIFDEHDSPIEEATTVELENGELLVEGSVLVDDLNDHYNLKLTAGEYDTIAGFIIHHLGTIPQLGQEVKRDNVTLVVDEMSQNRITRVRLLRVEKDNDSNVLVAHSFEPSTRANESNLIGTDVPKRLSASGER
jgi:putative hemolysin